MHDMDRIIIHGSTYRWISSEFCTRDPDGKLSDEFDHAFAG